MTRPAVGSILTTVGGLKAMPPYTAPSVEPVNEAAA